MMKISLSSDVIAAVRPFAANCDPRRYLYNVGFFAEKGSLKVIATDGCAAIIVNCACDDGVTGSFSIEAAALKHIKPKGSVSITEVNGVVTVEYAGEQRTYPKVELPLQSWILDNAMRLAVAEVTNESVTFSAKYLSLFQKAGEILSKNKKDCAYDVLYRGSNAATIVFPRVSSCIGILAGLRVAKDKQGVPIRSQIPEWVKA